MSLPLTQQQAVRFANLMPRIENEGGANIKKRIAKAKAEWARLEREVGRKVSQVEIFERMSNLWQGRNRSDAVHP